MTQKFDKYDHVRIAKDLGPHMSHFTSNCEAIIIGSYADQFGGTNTGSYTVYLKNQGEVSWYEEHQLTLIKANQIELYKTWKFNIDEEDRIKSDLNWIFENGPEVLAKPHGASIQALANCFGLTNLWGSHGEGYVWHLNAMKTLEIATPFLETNDKEGWLKLCEKIKCH